MIQWLMIKGALGRGWVWVRDNAVWLVLLAIGAWTGAKLLKRKDSQVSSLKEGLVVEKAKAQLERLRGERDGVLAGDQALVERDQAAMVKVDALEYAIKMRKQAILAVHDKKLDVSQMTDLELEEHFRRVGL